MRDDSRRQSVRTASFRGKLSGIDSSLALLSYCPARGDLRAQLPRGFRWENFPECVCVHYQYWQNRWRTVRQDITDIIYLPRSSRLSSMLTALAWCEGPIDSLMPGLPGWITRTRATPRTALSKDVSMKYTRVRTAIIPFILAFKLAEPGTRAETHENVDATRAGLLCTRARARAQW